MTVDWLKLTNTENNVLPHTHSQSQLLLSFSVEVTQVTVHGGEREALSKAYPPTPAHH